MQSQAHFLSLRAMAKNMSQLSSTRETQQLSSLFGRLWAWTTTWNGAHPSKTVMRVNKNQEMKTCRIFCGKKIIGYSLRKMYIKATYAFPPPKKLLIFTLFTGRSFFCDAFALHAQRAADKRVLIWATFKNALATMMYRNERTASPQKIFLLAKYDHDKPTIFHLTLPNCAVNLATPISGPMTVKTLPPMLSCACVLSFWPSPLILLFHFFVNSTHT